MNHEIPIGYDPRLIEEAVFLALRRHPETATYHRERDLVYEIADPEAREGAFRELNLRWFDRLGLGNPVAQALAEAPGLAGGVGQCVVVSAAKRHDEEAELFVNSEPGLSDKGRRTVRILVRPESLLDPPALMLFLRHELLHISDMIDPRFGYEPALPVTGGGPGHRRLLVDRYRALWDATIDGRMARRGWAPESLRDERWHDFCRAFPMPERNGARAFSRFFDQEGWTHPKLLAFALDPGAVATTTDGTASAGSRCSLCGFPTHAFAGEPERLPAEAIAAIVTDFPQWQPSHGLCLQCADLYRARELSLRAAESLPGKHGVRPSGYP